MQRRSEPVRVVRAEGSADDQLVREEPLTVRLAARGGPATDVWTTLRTPGHDLDLALGWALAQGLVTALDDVVQEAERHKVARRVEVAGQ